MLEDKEPECEYKDHGGCSSKRAIIPISKPDGGWLTFCYKHSLEYLEEQKIKEQKEIILKSIKELKEEGKI